MELTLLGMTMLVLLGVIIGFLFAHNQILKKKLKIKRKQ